MKFDWWIFYFSNLLFLVVDFLFLKFIDFSCNASLQLIVLLLEILVVCKIVYFCDDSEYCISYFGQSFFFLKFGSNFLLFIVLLNSENPCIFSKRNFFTLGIKFDTQNLKTFSFFMCILVITVTIHLN